MIEIVIAIMIGMFFLILLATIGWVIGKYNFFQIGIQNIKTQWSNIKTEYQRRFDLLVNLSKTVKSYKKHEKTTFVEVTQARKLINFKGSKQKQVKSMGLLNNLLSGLQVQIEAYPELKANEQHNKLIDELRITEDRVNVARTDYNDIVRTFNVEVKTFPSSIIANLFRFKEEKFYLNEQRSNISPRVELE